MVHNCPIGTSGVVFRRAVMPRVRFPRTLRGPAWEDYWVFWALLVRSSAIMYCPEPTSTYGSGGVGIAQHVASDSVGFLVQHADYIRFMCHVLNNYHLSPAERRFAQKQIALRREQALMSAVAVLRRRQENPLKEVMYLLRDDPVCAASWCFTLLKVLYSKLRGAPLTS